MQFGRRLSGLLYWKGRFVEGSCRGRYGFSPKGPWTQIVYTFTLKRSAHRYFGAKVCYLGTWTLSVGYSGLHLLDKVSGCIT